MRLLAGSGGTARSGAVRAIASDADACPGAPLPDGYDTIGRYPYLLHSPTGSGYNPQGVALFMLAAWADPYASSDQRLCLLSWAAQALIDRSEAHHFTDEDGKQRTARLYPYPSSFSANPSLPALKPGWVSGLAQASVLVTLASLADSTADPSYLNLAGETFNPFPGGGCRTVNSIARHC